LNSERSLTCLQVGFEAAGVQSSLDVLVKYVEKGGEVIILGVYKENQDANMFIQMEGERSMKVMIDMS